MTKNAASSQWSCIGRSIRGASHEISGAPNQDAIKFYPETGLSLPKILAISDGHGSAKSFRSDRGSQLAVETAIQVFQEFFVEDRKIGADLSISQLDDIVPTRFYPLQNQLLRRWREAVTRDYEEDLFTDEEKEKLVKKEGEKSLRSIETNPHLVYGATLLTVLVTEWFIVYLQLGDGDILTVDATGKVSRPLERDPNLLGNETTSLCTEKISDAIEKAPTNFQMRVQSFSAKTQDKMPVVILASTDGYANSYDSDEKFFKIGPAYLELLKNSGVESADEQLAEILQETTSGGSGDDITLGIIKRLEVNDKDFIKRLDRDLDRVATSVNSASQEIAKTGEDIVRLEENISKISSQIEGAATKQKKIDRQISTLNIGLICTLPLTLVNLGLCTYLLWNFQKMEATITGLEQNISRKKGG